MWGDKIAWIDFSALNERSGSGVAQGGDRMAHAAKKVGDFSRCTLSDRSESFFGIFFSDCREFSENCRQKQPGENQKKDG